MTNLLDKITTLASRARSSGDYKLAAVLSRVATDIGFVETSRYFIKQFKTARAEVGKMQKELTDAHLYKLSEELDVIARDLENKIIAFEAEDPIEAVLDSYKIIHKVAKTQKQSSHMQEILNLADNDDLTDEQLTEEIKRQTMGMPLNDKKNILYVLEKDYNISIPLEKVAFANNEFIKNPKTKAEKKHNNKIVEKVMKEYYSLPEKERSDFKFPASFPSQPYIWSGFAYEAIIPYQQSSQLNYWSLASKKEQEILKKVARIQK